MVTAPLRLRAPIAARCSAVTTRRVSPPERVRRGTGPCSRRSSEAAPGADSTRQEVDQDSYEARRSGHLIDLSPTEYRLLRYLLLNPGRVLTRSQILTGRTRRGLLTVPAATGPGGVPQAAGHPWDSQEAAGILLDCLP